VSNIYPGDKARIERFEGEAVHLYVQQALSDYPGLAAHANVRELRSQTIDALIFMLSTWCLSGRIPDRIDSECVSYPDGVWQMFKDRYMPYWFTQRWPVREKTVTVERTVNHYFVCPHLVTDPHQLHVQFMATGTRQAASFR
jgi:hypothetical protein